MRLRRAWQLTQCAREAGIKAKLENGELTITIPKLDSPILPEARPCPRHLPGARACAHGQR